MPEISPETIIARFSFRFAPHRSLAPNGAQFCRDFLFAIFKAPGVSTVNRKGCAEA
jgi:hypothetical protein